MNNDNKYYVAMTDYYRSRWVDPSRGKKCKYVVECDNLQQAEQIKKTAKKRYEMKYANLHTKQPYYSPSRYEVTCVHYNELGVDWTENKYYTLDEREYKKFYIAMTDTTARYDDPKTKIRVIECDTLEQAEQIERMAYENPGVKDIAVHFRKQQYNLDQYNVSELHYNDMGKIWTDGKFITQKKPSL